MQQFVYKTALVLAKIGVFLIAFLSFIGGLAVALTQYEPFRQWAIGKGLEAVNGALAGRLEVKDIEGNFITGLTVREACLIAGDTTLVFAPRIELDYMLAPFFESKRIIASAVLHNPQINLRRNAEGVWNFAQIAKPSTDTTQEPRTPLAWTFDIRNLEIRDATLSIYDAVTPPAANRDTVLDLLHSTLDQLNLGMNAFISEDEQNVEIDNLSFLVRETPFRVVELAGEVSADEEGLQVEGLRVETAGSYFELDASMDSVRLFDTAFADAVQRNPFDVELQGERIDTRELQMLLPSLSFLGGTASLDLAASGTMDELEVERLNLNLTRSYLRMKGRLENLRDPENLRIETAVAESRISYEDVPVHIPGLPIPDLRYLGEVELKTLTYSGTRNDLTSVFDITSDIGEIRGGGWFDYGSDIPAWRTDAIVKGLDISPILGDPLYKGTLNAHIVAEGKGFDPEVMTARVRMKGAASDVAGRKLARLWFQGGIGDGGMITADTLLMAWGNVEGGSTLEPLDVEELQRVLDRGRGTGTGFMNRLRLNGTDAAIFDGLPSLRLSGWYDMRNPDNPRYRALVETDRLNVADITLDPEQTTRLGLTLTVEGEGLDPDRINARADLQVSDALLPGGKELRPFDASVVLKDTAGGERLLAFTSDILDARLQGQWQFASLVPTLSDGFNRLINYISRKQSYGSDEYNVLMTDDGGIAGRPINARYEFIPKDLSIAGAFLEGMNVEMDATLSGEIRGTGQLLTLTSSGRIARFRYLSDTDTLGLQAASIDVNIQNISATSMDQLLDATVSVRSDSVIRYNDMELQLPKMDLTFEDGVLHANGVATLNREYSVALDGTMNVSASEGYIIEMDTLIFGMSRTLRWRNIPGEKIRLVLSEQGLNIESFRLYRRGAEAISVEGEFLEFQAFRNLRLSVTALPLQQLRPFIVEAETLAMVETLNGNLRDLTVTLNGTLEEPVIQATVDINGLSYTTIPIGDLDIELDYRAQNLTGSLRVQRPLDESDTSDIPLAQVDIETMPIDLAFASREERFISGRPLNITANATDLPIAIAGPFSTGLLLQQGLANLNFTVSGIYPDLAYSGEGNVRDGLIAVEATNVSYIVNAKFGFQDRILNINSVSLQNLPGDLAGGRAVASGRIEFDGFTPSVFDINISTPNRERGILLLSDATQAVNQNVYGDLVIANTNEGDPIRFQGSLDAPRLSGNVTVISSSMIVPYRESAATASQRVEFVDYAVWQDRQSRPAGPLLPDSLSDPDIPSAEELKRRQDQGREANDLDDAFDLAQRRRDTSVVLSGEESFVDNMDINLQLTLTDRVFIRIQLGPLQELALNLENANEREPLRFHMLGDDMSLSGQVQLGERSRFIYLKTFEARGTVSFDEDITNPEFNIEGTYEGRRFINERSEDYTVDVAVTGPLNQLNIEFSYSIAGVEATEDPEQRRINAVFLLLFGRRADENLGSNALEGLVEQSTSSVGTSAVNAAIGELTRNIEFLQALEIDLGQATDLGQARVNLVGQLGKTLVRYNGKVSSPEDGTISIELPLSLLGDAEELRAFVLELQREVIDQFESLGGSSGLANTQGDVYRMRVRFRTTW